MALQLMKGAGLEKHKGPWSIKEIRKIQAVSPTYQHVIFSKENINQTIFVGPENEKQIYLYLHNDNYDLIIKLPAFFGTKYFCSKCHLGYNHQYYHKCNKANRCDACNCIEKCEFIERMHCTMCNRYFLDEKCFENHKNFKMAKRNNKIQRSHNQKHIIFNFKHELVNYCKTTLLF